MNPPNDSRPAESKCAGMWRSAASTFEQRQDAEKRGEVIIETVKDGKPFMLDESPEAIAEARQEKLVHDLKAEKEILQAACSSENEEAIVRVVKRYGHSEMKKINRLTVANEQLKRERDSALGLASRAAQYIQGTTQKLDITDVIASIKESK